MSSFYNKLKKKSQRNQKINHLIVKYDCILLVELTNVNCTQIQECRRLLGKNSILIIEKNSLVRKILKESVKFDRNLDLFITFISGNIGIIFSKLHPFQIYKMLESKKIYAMAKTGQISQCDVNIPAGQTELSPEGTVFFQVLNIQTRIQKGQIEVVSPITLLKQGQVIGNAEAILLQKLNIMPFYYKITIKQIINHGICYGPSVLNTKTIDIINKIEYTKRELNIISVSSEYPNFVHLKNSIKKIFFFFYILNQFILNVF